MTAATPALRVEGLSKSFGGTRVLDRIALTVWQREIHGLLGQNGSGKSTFVKLLAGYHTPDPGATVEFFGRATHLPLDRAAQAAHGLAFVHQNLGLIPTLSVLENLRVASIAEARRWYIGWRQEYRAASDALRRFDVGIDPRARVDTLSQVDRALLAIVRAFESLRQNRDRQAQPGLLVLDEPTPFLPRSGVEQLFGLMRRIVVEGASVIFISHDVDEVREITDRATVLRDGVIAGSFVTAETSREAIIEHIVGRQMQRYRTGQRELASAIAVQVRGLKSRRVASLDLGLRSGEIVGLTGLVGAGHEQVLYHLYGATQADSGTLQMGHQSLPLATLTPRLALRAGAVLLPGDRQGASGIGSLTMAENLFLPDIARFFRRGWLRRREVLRATRAACDSHEVRPPRPELPLSALSGGNAQKVLLARWLKLAPRLVLLDEPTQGVDVGARQSLLRAVRATADAGAAVLCSSTDHEQLADLCDRVVIFSRGRAVAELLGATLTKENIASRCYAAATAA